MRIRLSPRSSASFAICLAAEYDVLRNSAAGTGTREQIRALVRGRMHLLAAAKRDSTRSAYAGGRKPIETFSTELGVPLFPASPIVLMDFVVHQLSAGLDSSTIKNRLTAVGDAYEYCRVHLRMLGLKNPLRDSQLVDLNSCLKIADSQIDSHQLVYS